MTIDDLGSASERGCFLPLFFLYLYITIGDPNRTRRACTITTTTITTTTTAAAAAATTTRLDRLFPLRGQFYPSRSPPLSTPLFYLFLDQDGPRAPFLSFRFLSFYFSPPPLLRPCTPRPFFVFFFSIITPCALCLPRVNLPLLPVLARQTRARGRPDDDTRTRTPLAQASTFDPAPDMRR